MKDTNSNKLENKSSLISGLLLGILFVNFIPEFFQHLVASIAGADHLHYEFKGILLYSLFYLPENLSLIASVLVYFSGYFLVVIIIELLLFFLKKTEIGVKRFTIIITTITITGYLIGSIFYGAFVTVLKWHSYNDIKLFFAHINLTDFGEIGIIFLVILVTLAYISSLFRRIQAYITSY